MGAGNASHSAAQIAPATMRMSIFVLHAKARMGPIPAGRDGTRLVRDEIQRREYRSETDADTEEGAAGTDPLDVFAELRRPGPRDQVFGARRRLVVEHVEQIDEELGRHRVEAADVLRPHVEREVRRV